MAGTLAVVGFSEAEDRYFQRMRSALVDKNIYDTGSAAVPYRAKSVNLSGQVAGISSPTTLQVWRNNVLQGTVTTAASGAFTIGVALIRGKNQVEVRRTTGEIVGAQVYLNAYTFGTFMSAAATELSTARALLEQVRQDAYLDDGQTLDGVASTTSAQGLRENFGQYVSGRRFPTFTDGQYRDFLKKLFEAYRLSTSVEAFDLISLAYGGALFTPRYFKNRTDAYTPGGGIKMVLRGYTGYTLDYSAVDVWMYRRWLRLPNGAITLAANKKYWLYVDGDVLAHNLIELKALEILDADTDVPLREEQTFTETIPQSRIRTDSTGRLTGGVGTTFVRAQRIPLTLSNIQGTIIGSLNGTAAMCRGTRAVSLGVQTPAAEIGDITLTYAFNREVRVFARVTTGASAVTKVEFNARLRNLVSPDGTCNGAQVISYGSRYNAFIYIIPNRHLLPADLAGDLSRLLDEIKPAHKLILEYAEPVGVGSDLFPLPFAAEIGATTRGQVDTIDAISAEIGATTRGQIESAVVEPLTADLGATSRHRTLS